MIPDYFDPFIAYRVWFAHPNGLLIGQAHAEPWPPYQPFVARCGWASSQDHIKEGQWQAAPVMSCDCGIHVLKTEEQARYRVENSVNSGAGLGFSYRHAELPSTLVWGAVKVWGHLIEHEDGYRAEFAYPFSLLCEDREIAAKVSQLYGVECLHHNLNRPTVQDDSYYWLNRINLGFTRVAIPVTHSFWRNSKPAPSALVIPKFVTQASLSQIKAIGATKWQQAQRQMQSRQALRDLCLTPNEDWQGMWKNGFKKKVSNV